jgi:DNA-binding response OmpR family regulator
MLKTIKNIRKLDNVKLLFLSSDKEIQTAVESEFDDYFKELKLVATAKEALQELQSSKFDLLIIDTDIQDVSFEEFCEQLREIKSMIPNIVISEIDSNENIVTAINMNAYTFLGKPIKQRDLKLSIIMCLNQTKRSDKIEFQEGIYFDEYRDQFFRDGGIIIEFTKLEKAFIKLLISKKGDTVDYQTIKEVVWKGKDMSIFTMRNIVNKIRQKTYYDIIKNKSNRGYVIDQVK